jgi:hypothetical protein
MARSPQALRRRHCIAESACMEDQDGALRELRSTYVVTLMTRALQRSIVARMSTSSSECQILAVGAGPTGLVLAAGLLARRDPHPDRRHQRQSGPGELSASVPDVGSRQNVAIRRGL